MDRPDDLWMMVRDNQAMCNALMLPFRRIYERHGSRDEERWENTWLEMTIACQQVLEE